MPEEGTGLITTPLYHSFGGGVLGSFLARRHRMVIKARFDPLDFLETVEREGITSAPVVPTLIIRLAKLPPEEWARFNTSSLKWICHTAAPCPAWAKQTLIDRLGPIVVEFLGSSEGTGPVVCTSEEWMSHPGTIGRPNPRLEASVVDDQGNDLPVGSIGTLYFRRVDGPPVYHGDDEKTEKSRLPDGRFTVGDVGWMDAEGFIYLADRRVDLILSGGVNVYPAEIEAVLLEHAAVRDAASLRHPRSGIRGAGQSGYRVTRRLCPPPRKLLPSLSPGAAPDWRHSNAPSRSTFIRPCPVKRAGNSKSGFSVMSIGKVIRKNSHEYINGVKPSDQNLIIEKLWALIEFIEG